MGAPAGPQYIQIIDTTGPLVGATIEYTDLSDNARAVYSDATLLTSLGGTLSGGNASDSKGRFPIHFLDPSLDYKRVIKTSAGATWRTDNPVQTANDDLADYLPLAGGTSPIFQDTGGGSGTCSLVCHGVTHENVSYP